MSEWKKVKIGDFLTESKIIAIESNAAHRITVRLNCKGVEQRSLKAEKEGATKYYTRKSGQFIYGKQNIHKGAFGIIPQELDGFTSSADLPAFDVDLSKCIPEWICICLQKDEYYKTLQKNVKGVGSQRLAVNVFLDSEIPLPPVEKQVEIIKKIKLQLQKTEQLSVEIESQKNYIKQLRQNILQEAIEGKDTAVWRKQNTAQRGNPDYDAEALFEQIQKERNNEKKQKELSPITDEEKPFEIPGGWKWVRLGDISDIVRGGSPRPAGDKNYYDGKIPFLKVADITNSDEKELWTYTYTIKEAGLKKTRFVEKETLMLTNSGATLGIPKICMIATTFNDGIAAFLDIKNRITKEYLYYFLKSKTQWFLKEAAKGQGQPNLNTDIISSTVFALPPLTEQKEVVTLVEKHLQTISDLENQITEREQLTKQLMQSILKDAFEEKKIDFTRV